MSINKIYKKFPIASIVKHNAWNPLLGFKPAIDTFGLVIHADQTYLYVLIEGIVVKINKWTIKKLEVVQRPYQKYV